MTRKNARPDVFPSRCFEPLFAVVFLVSCLVPGFRARAEQPAPTKTPAVPGPSVTVPLTLQKGTALRIALDQRVPIRSVGEPVEGVLLQPVYAFDRMVAPAGSKVMGHIIEVTDAPRKDRAQAILQGNFSPLRTAKVEFDTLVLKDGPKIPIQTAVAPGTAQVVHLETAAADPGKRENVASKAIDSAKQQIKAERKQVIAAVKEPGRMHRLKELLVAQLPYHRPALPAGTRFTAELEKSVAFSKLQVPSSELKSVGTVPPAGSVVEATLLTGLSSATAHRGTRVEAIITRPVFSKDHQLIIPEGSKLQGMVVQAEAARRLRFHRNGVLRFAFDKIQTPQGAPQFVEGSLAGVVVDKKEKLKLDSEGGAHSTTTKMDYAAPAIAVLIATTSAMPDRDVRPGRIYTDTSGPAGGQAVAGGMGYRLVGTLLALTIHYQPVTAALAAYGAGWSVYSHLLTRGQDVVFPKDTPMEIRFGEHRSKPRDAIAQPAAKKAGG
ncbi:MAG: hypothetical protein ACRD3T_10395 [Terriglobia bacterium]